MRFAHISDLHLCLDPAGTPSVNDDAVIQAERLAQDIRSICEILDFVVMTGDLTEDAAPESFALFEDLFSDIGLPMFLVPGNHDGPAAFHTYIQQFGLIADSDISNKVVELGDVRLIGIDTCIEGVTAGAIPETSLERLSHELGKDTTSQLLVVMHHPPFAPGQKDFNEISVLKRSDRFGQLLHQTEKSPIVLCGHVHRPYFANWNGVNCFVGGSPARAFAADPPFGTVPIQPSEEPFSYFVHALSGAGDHVMTPRWLGT